VSLTEFLHANRTNESEVTKKTMASAINRKVAESFHVCLEKLPEAVQPLEDGCEENCTK
jgi:hypothetical protein